MKACTRANHINGCPGNAGGDHVTKREDMIRAASQKLHDNGIKPTSRNVLAKISGKPESHFPQGMGGQDVIYFRKAMLDIGYVQTPKTHRWYFPKGTPPELDEVMCMDYACPEYDLNHEDHTLADHTIGWNWK